MGYYLTDETVEPPQQTASIRGRACEPKTAYTGFCCMGNINQYVFCGNNPVNFRDPFGRCKSTPTMSYNGGRNTVSQVRGNIPYHPPFVPTAYYAMPSGNETSPFGDNPANVALYINANSVLSALGCNAAYNLPAQTSVGLVTLTGLPSIAAGVPAGLAGAPSVIRGVNAALTPEVIIAATEIIYNYATPPSVGGNKAANVGTWISIIENWLGDN